MFAGKSPGSGFDKSQGVATEQAGIVVRKFCALQNAEKYHSVTLLYSRLYKRQNVHNHTWFYESPKSTLLGRLKGVFIAHIYKDTF